jgi:hypothetical protein
MLEPSEIKAALEPILLVARRSHCTSNRLVTRGSKERNMLKAGGARKLAFGVHGRVPLECESARFQL